MRLDSGLRGERPRRARRQRLACVRGWLARCRRGLRGETYPTVRSGCSLPRKPARGGGLRRACRAIFRRGRLCADSRRGPAPEYIDSLMLHGTPRNGSGAVSRSERANSSARFASSRACSNRSATSALRRGLTRWMCSMWRSTTSADESSPARIARARSLAERLRIGSMSAPNGRCVRALLRSLVC